MRFYKQITKQSLLAAVILFFSIVLSLSQAKAQNIILPLPETGSFNTAFNFIPDG